MPLAYGSRRGSCVRGACCSVAGRGQETGGGHTATRPPGPIPHGQIDHLQVTDSHPRLLGVLGAVSARRRRPAPSPPSGGRADHVLHPPSFYTGEMNMLSGAVLTGRVAVSDRGDPRTTRPPPRPSTMSVLLIIPSRTADYRHHHLYKSEEPPVTVTSTPNTITAATMHTSEHDVTAMT